MAWGDSVPPLGTKTFWNEQGRCFELDARGQRWREVPGIGPRPDPSDGWNPLTV